MRKRWFLLPVLFCLPFAAGFADARPRRLAIVNVGLNEKVPAPLIPLLEARLLAAEDGVVLLERAEADRLLREQELGLSAVDEFGGQRAMRAGEIWNVDAFCLISSEESHVRVRLVDAWHGLRLLDVALPRPGRGELERTASMIAGRVLQRLSMVTRDPKDLPLVGVLDMRSMEPNDRLDELERPLRFAVEQRLSHRADVVLTEREQVRPLLEERELADGLPERIRGSLVLVDGEFHLDPENPEVVNLYLQGRRDGVQAFRLEVQGPRDHPILLGQRAAEAIGGALGRQGAGRAMDPALEADMLLAQAKATRDAVSALGAAAAAKALMPGDETYEFAWLKIQASHRKNLPFTASRFERYIEACDRLAAPHLANPDFDPLVDLRIPILLLDQCASILEHTPGFSDEDRERFQRRLLERIDLYWELYLLSSGVEVGKTLAKPGIFFDILKRIQPIDADQAFRWYAEITMVAPMRVLRMMGDHVVWPRGLTAEQVFEQNQRLYTWMAERERSAVRLAGKRGLARIRVHPESGVDPAKTRAAYEEFEREFLTVYLPRAGHDPQGSSISYPSYPHWILPFLDEYGFDREAGPSRYHEDEEASRNYRADRIETFLGTVLNDPVYPQRVDWTWHGNLLRVLGRVNRPRSHIEHTQMVLSYHQRGLESVSRVNSGRMRSLRRSVEHYENHLHRLRREHPDLVSWPDNPRGGLEAQTLFSLREASVTKLADSQRPDARRLVLEHGMAAVLGSGGVLFLNPASLKPERYVPAPEGVRAGRWYAADESGIYTASRDGIVFFPKQGPAQAFFHHHPDLSAHVYDIEVLKGRVYLLTAQARHVEAQNAIEFNLETGVRTILMSVNSTVRDPAMRGLRDILFVVAEADKNRLHINVRKTIKEEHSVASYVYDPDEKTFTASDASRLFPFRTGEAKRRGTRILNVGMFGLAFLDMANGFEPGARIESFDHRFDSYGPIARVGEGLVGILHHRSQLNYFPGSGSDMLKIKYDVFPPGKGSAPHLNDLATHPEHGLLILGSDALYAVPSLTHDQSAGAISWTTRNAENGE